MKTLTLFFIMMVAPLLVMSQKMDEIAKLDDQKFVNTWKGAANYLVAPNKFTKGKEDGAGFWPVLSKLPGVPKKIALVTFYVYDAGTTQTSSVDVYKSMITPEGGNKFANAFLQEGADKIKSTFQSQGMQVLLPSEFLDTPEKKEIYNSFKPDFSGFTKAMSSTFGRGFGEASAANGFRFWYLMDGKDWKISNGLGGELCKGLGVDAVMVVMNDITTDGQYFSLLKTTMIVYGPNPIAPQPEVKYVSPPYQQGMLYQGVAMDVNRLIFQQHPKKGVLYEEYKGYDKIAGLMSEMIAYYLTDRVADGLGDWKKKK